MIQSSKSNEPCWQRCSEQEARRTSVRLLKLGARLEHDPPRQLRLVPFDFKYSES